MNRWEEYHQKNTLRMLVDILKTLRDNFYGKFPTYQQANIIQIFNLYLSNTNQSEKREGYSLLLGVIVET